MRAVLALVAVAAGCYGDPIRHCPTVDCPQEAGKGPHTTNGFAGESSSGMHAGLMRRIVRSLALALALSACAVADDDGFEHDIEETEQGATTLWYTPITKEYFLPSAKITAEVKKVFHSEAEWIAFFGKPSPGIDFTENLAIFYTPGTAHPDQQDPGWRTRLRRVSLSSTGKTLRVDVGVEYNGDCTYRSARPFITATVKRPATLPTYKKFYRDDTLRDCD